MSVIAVHGFPLKFSLKDVIKKLARPINGNFEALNFKTPKSKLPPKKVLRTCYIRLSEKLDPVRVCQQINSFKFATKLQYKAHIPDVVPDLPVRAKKVKIPLKTRLALQIAEDETHEQVLRFATEEIMLELQIKYPGLYSLSKKYDHKLLENLSKKLHKHLKELVDASNELNLCLKLTRAYRSAYPHNGDFQLVLETLHEIQDSVGVPRMDLEEADIDATPPAPLSMDLPPRRLRYYRNKCTERIISKMTNHIKSLDAEISPTDNEDLVARKKVRQELKIFLRYIPSIVNQLMDKHLMPQAGPSCRMRIYGEPFLPNKNVIAPLLLRFKPHHVMRSNRMYNLMKFSIPSSSYHQLTAAHGSVVNGAKLVIRSSDLAEYKGVGTALGLADQENQDEEDPMDVDEDENSDEEEEFE